VIPFHRVLIATGIAFCGGFALWALWQFAIARSMISLVLAGVFAALTAALAYYLRHLRRFIGR
jgi:hypothetical protein